MKSGRPKQTPQSPEDERIIINNCDSWRLGDHWQHNRRCGWRGVLHLGDISKTRPATVIEARAAAWPICVNFTYAGWGGRSAFGGRRRLDARALGEPHEGGKRVRLHFLHDSRPMDFDRMFDRAEICGNLLVELAGQKVR